jgi:ribonucleoside-diphosphate reductase alpha chain
MAKWTHANTYDVVFGHASGIETYTVDPNKILKEIATAAWDNGEPGVIYWDRFTNYNLMQYIDHYQIEGSNPCGEQPLPKNGACNLGAINLSEYVVHGRFDYESFKDDVAVYVTALDDLVTENAYNHALKEQTNTSLKWRNIGIGVMGMADVLRNLYSL